MIPTVSLVIPPIHGVTNTGETLPSTITITPIIAPSTGITIKDSTGVFLPEPHTEEVTEYPHQVEILNLSHPDVYGDATQYEVQIETGTAYTQAVITLTPETTTLVIGLPEGTP